MRAQLSVLRDIQHQYQGETLENIIQQLESRVKEAEKKL